jgi:hypothetical protein
MVFPPTHNHNTEVTLSGVVYARIVEIINGYTVDFEDGTYTVVCTGANHNIGDVKVVDNVSLIIGNSAGLIVVSVGSGLSSAQDQKLDELHRISGLKAGEPMTVVEPDGATPGSRISGSLELEITVPVEGTVVVERQ